MNKKIKICCVTGTRADYPRVKSVLKEIQKSKDFSLQIIVTGSHLLIRQDIRLYKTMLPRLHIRQGIRL